MLWEVDIYPAEGQPDVGAADAAASAAELHIAEKLSVKSARGYLIQGDFDREQIERIARELLSDPVIERTVVARVGDQLLTGKGDSPIFSARKLGQSLSDAAWIHVLPKSGVMDPVAQSAIEAIADFGLKAEAVRTLRKYAVAGLSEERIQLLCDKVLANDAIEQVIVGPLRFERLEVGSPYEFKLVTVPIREMDDAALERLSRDGQLFLSLVEMQTIQKHFAGLERDPTDVELETLAQTWSEHCSHKTLAGRIDYRGPDGERRFENMLKETIFAATREIRRELGDNDWCVSVFADNAGVIRFNERYNVVFKVETHNHPSALEPYGGANTGIGGVIRDPMGTGMGAKPICNTDVFCFAPPDVSAEELPPGVLHPRRIIKGVVAGVRDYGNRMGIPTVNGAIYFDRRYLGNPLVYCGNVGLIPREMSEKHPRPNDLIVAVGGRTGRDGIHGATFSSAELTSHSETLSGGAVQIGNAITEKMLLDVLLVARDRGLYNAVTDCGAGGFSSAVGEMGERIGAEVWLEQAPLKYEGLSYTEIWISEAQERMVLSVPPDKWEQLSALCESEGVEATVIGKYVPTGRLTLFYGEHRVGDLAMDFLHGGRPPVVREAIYNNASPRPLAGEGSRARAAESSGFRGKGSDKADAVSQELPCDFNCTDTLKKILGSPNVCSKQWVVRQYDHEVQGGSVLKPLVGAANDGPGDAAVLRPVLDGRRGIAVSCGMNPRYGDFDTYWMAASAIDEAVRNCVAVGADPARIAILDNFCWGATDRPETLGSLVRAAIACHDAAVALGTPFISGKDSLNNEFRPTAEGGKGDSPHLPERPEGCCAQMGTDPFSAEPISIPPSLLISAIGLVKDVARCVSMDLKEPGNLLYIVGETKDELGGSHFALVEGLSGGKAPMVDFHRAKATFAALHSAISNGLVRACHDLSEGGMAAAAAEMAFAGGLGAKISLQNLPSPAGGRGAGGEGYSDLPSPAGGRGAG
ncbi:MAG: phosphoribosylformylglycinamidine synthase, partial [Pirellulales bacterium]|nr:phosphoribosylformylglycinamidine synthase [Pirellulales bacterium]